MSTQLNLQEIERKAYLSTYQDGLWDIYLGLVVMCMSIFIYRPADGYTPTSILLALLFFFLAQSLYRVGKKYLTQPRLGQVQFGAIRQQKKATLAITLGVVVLLHVAFVAVTALGWLNPETGAKINEFFHIRDLMTLTVAALASFLVGSAMMLMAYFSDFLRGYYIAIMMSLAVFLMIYLNQPIYPLIIGSLILLPGLIYLAQFLKRHPRPQEETIYEQ